MAGEPGAAVGAGPRAGQADAMRRVFACLQAAGRPLGKHELLSRTAVTETDWPPVIHALLAAGAVRQQGSGRGTVYALPPP